MNPKNNKSRIVILVNKEFEYTGFIEGLRDTVKVYAGINGRDAECRFDNLIADIYCIQNLFLKTENSSNSEDKYNYLNRLFKSNSFRLEECDGVLSVSTSESTPSSQGKNGKVSRNGCVYVGNKFFLCDKIDCDPNTRSALEIGNTRNHYTEYYNKIPICKDLYKRINQGLNNLDFKPAQINSAIPVVCSAGEDYACVGVVNVMDYSCYKKADKSAYNQFLDSKYAKTSKAIGIETTHGVVVKALNDACKELKIKKDIPVNFISPIVDRYLKFDEDVDGKYGKQNFICSYNGGVATGHILTIMNKDI